MLTAKGIFFVPALMLMSVMVIAGCENKKQPPGSGAPAETSSSDPEPGMKGIEHIVEEERQRVSTAEDLLRKGFPAISNPRKTAMGFTAGKSLPELADNLGEISVMEFCRNQDVIAAVYFMSFWATAVPPNMIVLRLIEEGRERPDEVAEIVRQSIARKIEYLGVIRKRQLAVKSGQDSASIGVGTVHHEAFQTQFAIASAFYVLANIHRLNEPDLLAKWIATPKPRGYETMQVDTWYIDYYFRLTDAASSRHAAAHLAIAKNRILAGPKQVFSKWNQAWDVNDPLLRATGVNVKDLETIEVLRMHLRDPFTSRELLRIHQNFQQHVKQLQSTDGPTPKRP